MTELDFDELDKAVNSLMGDKKPGEPVVGKDDSDLNAAPAQPVVSPQPPVDTPGSEPIAKASADTPAPAAPEPEASRVAAPPAASIATKRRGQFMDVMHPSADMKSTGRTARPTARVSRQGVAVAPNPDSAGAPASQEVSTTQTMEPVTSPVTEKSTSDWPDPIDTATPVAPDASAVTATENPEPPVTPPELNMADTSTNPLDSPFLPDAKVEKRPLGQTQPIEQPDTNVDSQTEYTPESSADLPDELSGGVLAVESNDLHADDTSTKAPQETPPVTPAEQSAEPQPAAIADLPDDTIPVQASIPPQYKPDDSEAEPAEHSALYDEVSNAHAAKPPKKKHGWVIMLAIIGLVLLGCAGGVAVYYMMIG